MNARPLLLAALLLAPLRLAHAQGLDLSHGGPVDVTSRDGMEWRQEQQEVIARGDARAVRGDVTVTADTLIARYRKKAGAVPVAATPPAPGTADTGNNEIYRLEAEGNVHIYTTTDLAVGDHAVYDIDQSVLVLTGRELKLTTPQQVLTARDAMEYWSAKHMAVGRGDATVTTNDGRRLAGDTLVGYTTDPNAPPAPGAVAVPHPAPASAKPGADPLMASGKLQRVEAFGHVEVRTVTEIIHGDRGVYVPDTGIARVAGNVRITRGQNQLNGDQAIVNMRTGISDITRNPGGRVQGLVVPNEAGAGKAGAAGAPKATTPAPAPAPKEGR